MAFLKACPGLLSVAFSTLIWTCVSPAHAGPQEKNRDEPILKRVLWWFPEDTQTVSVARNISMSSATKERPHSLTDMIEVLALGALGRVEDGAYTALLQGQQVEISVEGSRRFRAPTGLGSMRYEGCRVIVFKNPLGKLADSLEKRMLRDASETIEIMDNRVAVFSEKLEQDVWTFFLTLPSPDVLLVATDKEYLKEVLSRRSQKKKGRKRALPEDLPEWKKLDVNSRFWAVRHYDPKDAALDPTSPLREKAAANVPDSQAIGLVFACRTIKEEEFASVKYLSSNPRISDIATELWRNPLLRLDPQIEANEGVVEVLHPVDDPSANMFVFVLLAALGHGIFP